MRSVTDILRGPEAMVGAGMLGLAAAAAVLVSLALASCQSDGGRARPAAGGISRPIAVTGEPEMRVRIAAAVETIRVSCASGLLVSPATVSGGGERVPAGRSVSFAVQGGYFVLGGGGEAAEFNRYPVSAQVTISADPGSAGTPIVVNGVAYAGRLRLIGRSDATDKSFDVVECVPLEQYLPGVVAKEMPRGWPAEAYRLQAVCARTYAIHERGRALADGRTFDVEASESDQAYAGAQEGGPALDAVRGTRGQVICYGDGVLRTYYSSTCGGRAASARDTWPVRPGFEFNLALPIQAHSRESACEDSPLYRWTVTRDRSEVVQRLRAFGVRNQLMVRRIKDVRAIEAAGYNDVGRPDKFKIVEPGGTWYSLSGEETRLALNTNAAGLPDIERKTRVNSSDIQVRVKGNTVTIEGRGFGHGVGMCQYCARAMAASGDDWRAMAARFYPGSRIVGEY